MMSNINLNVIMLNVLMMSVIMLTIIMLSVIMLNVIMLNVMAPMTDHKIRGSILATCLHWVKILSKFWFESKFCFINLSTDF